MIENQTIDTKLTQAFQQERKAWRYLNITISIWFIIFVVFGLPASIPAAAVTIVLVAYFVHCCNATSKLIESL